MSSFYFCPKASEKFILPLSLPLQKRGERKAQKVSHITQYICFVAIACALSRTALHELNQSNHGEAAGHALPKVFSSAAHIAKNSPYYLGQSKPFGSSNI